MNLKEKLKKLGTELKAVRQIKGLSLSAVARPARISVAYLQKLEAGVVMNPSPRVLHRLTGVLEISYLTAMELAGYIVPTTGDTADRAQGGLVEQALAAEDLTEEERKAVTAFVAYLKEQRKM